MSSALLSALLAFALVAVSLAVYSRAIRAIHKAGEVKVSLFGVPDLILGFFFISWFTMVSIGSYVHGSKAMSEEDILPGSLLFLGLVAFIASFLALRKIPVLSTFGFARQNLLKVLGYAAGFLVAAYPLVSLAAFATQQFLGADAAPQEIVRFFVEAKNRGNQTAVLTIVGLSVILAPMAEEFIFRGYIYGVLKRHFGMLAGAFFNALLFAAVHSSVTSLAPLFVLALCLTIAYEKTGSILVPMFMHALFNSIMFVLLLNVSSLPK